MGIQPKTPKQFGLKVCSKCGGSYSTSNYIPTKSFLFSDHFLPICNNCITEFLEGEGHWEKVDYLCQLTDIPFIPAEWQKVYDNNKDNPFQVYANIFRQPQYSELNWKKYYDTFLQLQKASMLEEELPLIREEKYRKLRERWGSNYDEDDLNYLDKLYNGLLNTQNVNGDLQTDQAIKVCKISLEIDSRIREGADFDKILSSYEKIVKIAGFTPKNAKNAADFDSCGELIKWLEKRGWVNQYYDNVPRDVVDETMHNIQVGNRRLYTNESGIGEEITQRLENLKKADSIEKSNFYGLDDENEGFDLDQYDNEGYEDLMNQEFVADLEGGDSNA